MNRQNNDHEMRDLRLQSKSPETASHEANPTSSPRSSITARETQPAKRHRNALQVPLVLFYMTITLLSWILFCVMTYKPYGQKSYFYNGDSGSASSYAREHMVSNERYIVAARVLHTIAALLTIPVTGYVCTVAAMAYLQSGRNKTQLTVMQSIAVADQKWLSPESLTNYGSLPLYVGFWMTLLGALAQLLQSGLVGQEFIRVPSVETKRVVYFTEPFGTSSYDDMGLSVIDLQNMIASSNTNYNDNLWADCGGYSCRTPESAWSSFETYTGPTYMTPFAHDFHTGVYAKPQFAPRIHTKLSNTGIAEEVFKKECRNETESGAFYANYTYRTDQEYNNGFNIEVCITGDVRKSPWKKTRDRQDISETLYFSFVLDKGDTGKSGNQNTNAYPNYFKLSAQSSFGYFELPSHYNNNTAGPIRDKDPFVIGDGQIYSKESKRAENDSSTSYGGSKGLLGGDGHGPLTSLGLALFGYRSFVGARMLNMSSFVEQEPPRVRESGARDRNCASAVPFRLEMRSGRCAPIAYDTDMVGEHVYDVMKQLSQTTLYTSFDTKSYFDTGLNMTNYMFITGRSLPSSGRKIPVNTDEGVSTARPSISKAGIITGSVFLGLHLVGLVSLSVYCLFYKLTASRLGAEMMLRFGVTHADVLQHAESERYRDKFLDTLPALLDGGSR